MDVKGRLRESPVILEMPALLQELQARTPGAVPGARESGEPSKNFYSLKDLFPDLQVSWGCYT